MKAATLVAKSAFSGRELTEVARGPRADVVEELKDDSSGGP